MSSDRTAQVRRPAAEKLICAAVSSSAGANLSGQIEPSMENKIKDPALKGVVSHVKVRGIHSRYFERRKNQMGMGQNLKDTIFGGIKIH